jgi:hypothetical protein
MEKRHPFYGTYGIKDIAAQPDLNNEEERRSNLKAHKI